MSDPAQRALRAFARDIVNGDVEMPAVRLHGLLLDLLNRHESGYGFLGRRCRCGRWDCYELDRVARALDLEPRRLGSGP